MGRECVWSVRGARTRLWWRRRATARALPALCTRPLGLGVGMLQTAYAMPGTRDRTAGHARRAQPADTRRRMAAMRAPNAQPGSTWHQLAPRRTVAKGAGRIATPRPTGACALPAPPRPCRQRRARPSRTANAIRATRGLTEGHARLAQMDISRVSMALLVVRSALKGSSQRASVRRRMLRAALVS